MATAPSPNLSSRACAADDIPTFADLKALAELMDDGYLLCRGDARPLHANAAALALVNDEHDALAALARLLPADAIATARADGRWNGDLSLDDGLVLQVRA